MKNCYARKFRAAAFVLFFVLTFALSFALVGCTDPESSGGGASDPPDMVSWYNETVGGIDWTVHYYSVSREISSINASYTENDRSSDYWKFSAYYHGDSNLPVKHSVSLVGSPVGDGWFVIEKTELYIMSASSVDDLGRVQKTYPSCTQDPFTFDITLSERVTRYEEKLIFSLPSANAD